MNLRNNNQEIIQSLAAKSYRYNRGRNRVLISAVAVAVIVVFGVLSLAAGRLEAEHLSDIRDTGVAASYTLKNPTEAQYQKIKDLSYVRYAGREWNFGTASDKQSILFYCVATSETSFRELYAPAVTNINGSYPKNRHEVMLPTRVLEDMGIQSPKVGMMLELAVKEEKNTETFTLSGYFTDHKMRLIDLSRGFFSPEIMGAQASPDTLRIKPAKVLTKESGHQAFVESLRRDAGIPAKQEIEEYYTGYLSEYEPAGGYAGAWCLVALLLLCAVLLINNVTYISIKKDVRYYGLLKTLGATQKQIEKIVLKQVLRISVLGIFLGIVISCGLMLLLLPSVIEKLYLAEYGPAQQLLGIHPLWLAATALLVFITTLLSAMEPARRVSRTSPVEARSYVNSRKRARTVQSGVKGGRVLRQAWRNAFQNKRKSAVTIFSLALGITIALSASMVLNNQSPYWEGDQNQDFQIDTTYTPGISGEAQIDQALERKIRSMAGIKAMQCNYGAFFSLDKKDAVWELLGDDMHGGAVLVDEEYIEKLGNYAQKQELQIDVKGLKNGESAVEIYANRRTQQKPTDEHLGAPFNVLDEEGQHLGKLNFAGFLDCTQEGFPQTQLIIHSLDTPILMMTEKGFRRAGLEKQIQAMSLSVEPEAEPEIKKELTQLIQRRNKELRIEGRSYYPLKLYSKSDADAAQAKALRAARIMDYGMSGLLILLGLMNYIHIVITGLFTRQRDFALLECVGMTRKQLRRMLMLEGCYYTAITVFLTFLLGAGAMNAAAAYFRIAEFSYPWAEMLGICGALTLISIAIPLLVYRKQKKESIIERLRYKG